MAAPTGAALAGDTQAQLQAQMDEFTARVQAFVDGHSSQAEERRQAPEASSVAFALPSKQLVLFTDTPAVWKDLVAQVSFFQVRVDLLATSALLPASPEPALLLGGAAWYGLLSVLWCAVFMFQPVQQNLAQLYRVLGDYLRLKASLFEPVRGVDVEVRRLALAQLNGQVVNALNIAKERSSAGSTPAAAACAWTATCACISWRRTYTNAPAPATTPMARWWRPSSTAT